MKLQILTPDKAVFDGEVESILVPGAAGPFQILKNHAAILSSLIPGELRIKIGHKESYYNVTNGFFEFHQNQGVVLADAAETPEEIDMKRVASAKQRATEALTNPSIAATEKVFAKKALIRAEARKKISEKVRS